MNFFFAVLLFSSTLLLVQCTKKSPSSDSSPVAPSSVGTSGVSGSSGVSTAATGNASSQSSGAGTGISSDEKNMLDMFNAAKSSGNADNSAVGMDPAGAGGSGGSIAPFQDDRSSKFVLGSYTSAVLNHPKENLGFYCPGDAVISGLQSDFDVATNDRKFQVECQYFSDANGNGVRRTACTDSKVSGELLGEQTFSCPNQQVLAGISSTYDGPSGDRSYTYQCCSLVSNDKTPLQYDTTQCTTRIPRVVESRLSAYWLKITKQNGYGAFSVNDQVNDWKEHLMFTCQLAVNYDPTKSDDSAITQIAGGVLRSISSTYSSSYHDRRWSFQCCGLTTASKPL